MNAYGLKIEKIQSIFIDMLNKRYLQMSIGEICANDIALCRLEEISGYKNIVDRFGASTPLKNFMSEQDIDNLVSWMVALYLDEWLESDLNATQTINGLINNGFQPVNERQRSPLHSKYNPDENEKWPTRDSLRNAEKDFNIMMGLQKEQAEEEGYPRKADTVPLSRCNKKIIEQESANYRVGRSYDFVTLNSIRWLSNDKSFSEIPTRQKRFKIYELLINNKEILKKTNYKDYDYDRNNPLRFCYSDYRKAIEDAKNDKDDKLYTINSITVQKFEQQFAHIINACLASDIQQSANTNVEQTLRKAIFWFYRDTYSSGIVVNTSNGNMHDNLINPMDCFEIMKIVNEPNSETFLKKGLIAHIKRRIAIEINVLINIQVYSDISISKLLKKEWTTDDYAYAAKFFREKYPIIDNNAILQLPDPEKWSDSMCESIIEIYKSPLFGGMIPWRERHKEAANERNKKRKPN